MAITPNSNLRSHMRVCPYMCKTSVHTHTHTHAHTYKRKRKIDFKNNWNWGCDKEHKSLLSGKSSLEKEAFTHFLQAEWGG